MRSMVALRAAFGNVALAHTRCRVLAVTHDFHPPSVVYEV
ncbi:hypothetical protein FM113_15920 [Leucobacter sp. 7(1)]|nr:hypothetical protein FM113_15920 [Leucobacter sp. 7(1)]